MTGKDAMEVMSLVQCEAKLIRNGQGHPIRFEKDRTIVDSVRCQNRIGGSLKVRGRFNECFLFY